MRCYEAMREMTRLDRSSGPADGDSDGGDHSAGTAVPSAEALAHVAGCGACLARLDQLGRAVLSPLADEPSCAECRERLPDLREVLAGGDARPTAGGLRAEIAATVAHLHRCPYCVEELGALDAVMAAWDQGLLPALDGVPALDLTFLDAPVGALAGWASLESSVEAVGAPEPGLWLVNAGQATRAVAGELRTLLAEIVVALGERGAEFGRMAALLAPVSLPAPAMRDAGPSATPAMILLPDPSADLSIRLAIGPMVDRRAVVDLTLNQDADGAPLADTRVVLYDGEERLLASAMTADDGRAQFRDLGRGRYVFEIRRPGRRWRLPLRVTAEGGEGDA
jgi:hypothetical protein